MPRKRHAQQDPHQKEAFKEKIVDKLEAVDDKKGGRVRIWVQNEHRYGLISNIRRVWTLRGHRVVAPVVMKYQWGYVYGACELVTGDAEFLFMPSVSIFGTEIFLNQLVASDPQAIHIVLWDQGASSPQARDRLFAKADTYRGVSAVLSGTESDREIVGSGQAPRC